MPVYAIAPGSVKNIKINVTLNFLGPGIGSLPTFADFLAQFGDGGVGGDRVIREVRCGQSEIKWQQKIDNRYKSNAPGQLNDENEENRIFTYIDGENLPALLKDREEYEGDNDYRRFETHKFAPRNRRIAPSSYRNPIVDNPTDEFQRRMRNCWLNRQQMLIMAYTGPVDQPQADYDPSDEHVLLRLVLLNERLLFIEPDVFVESEHRIESRNGLFEVSVRIDQSVDQKQRVDQKDIEQFYASSAKGADDVLHHFDQPQNSLVKWLHLVEINKAIDFDHSPLAIEYQLELPDHVTPADPDCLRGRSQIGAAVTWNEHDISHFAFVFELALNHRMDVNGKGWPRLLLRVTSDDEWGRHYVEGYASLALPTLPGRQTIRASCWRPRPMDNVDRLREYFIGQAVDLPRIESCSLDNKKPFETESSGQIELKIETALQSRLLVSLEAQKKAQYANIMRRIGLDTDLHWKIMKVLMEFEEAKRRLLLVKKKTS